MYVTFSGLGYTILGILAAAALIYLIMALNKLSKVLARVDKILGENELNINKVTNYLPKASQNIAEITDNIKDISEVLTTTTADAIDIKEDVEGYLITLKEIISIVKNVFFK
ncbi:hypothetical protein KPL33_03400 [Clostridium algidicarnis]|uniref:hypothetical protein n=1 Tax=Clostridium algidicarnis TaxID=37659 RepID=UPI001C0B87A8|nr:hypothetical protein [Clostridium algidicarnis]MBU3206024.1 hypothetical protein [Clostridium algidicarnis]